MFPASAGMNRANNDNEQDIKYVPRERGDEPSLFFVTHIQVKCSPRARG